MERVQHPSDNCGRAVITPDSLRAAANSHLDGVTFENETVRALAVAFERVEDQRDTAERKLNLVLAERDELKAKLEAVGQSGGKGNGGMPAGSRDLYRDAWQRWMTRALEAEKELEEIRSDPSETDPRSVVVTAPSGSRVTIEVP